MRYALAIFALMPFALLADLVIFDNYEIGKGYRDSGGAYYAHSTGVYLTITREESNERGYLHYPSGAETVIAGTHTENATADNWQPYTAVIYRGSFQVYSESVSNNPFGMGIPYSGGSGPISAGSSNRGFNDNGNSISQGGLKDTLDTSSGGGGGGGGGGGSAPDLDYGLSNNDFVAYDSSGVPHLYSLNQIDGQWYLSDGSGVSIPISDPSAIPTFYKDSSGNLVQGFYNSSSGSFSSSPSGGSGGDDSGTIDTSSIVNAINSQGSLTRDQLVQLLGSSGSSWVYDCKLSLSQLYALASSQGLITRPQVDFSGLYSRLDTIANKSLSVDTSSLAKESTLASVASGVSSVNANITSLRSDVSSLAKETTLQSAVSSLSSIDGKFSTIGLDIASMKNILQDWNNTIVPVFNSSPDFGDDSPDDELPFDVSGFNASVTQSLGTLVSWGDSGVPKVFDFDIVSHLLSDMIGTIPSVGSDPVMFSIDFDLPYLGHINKTFSFADYPFVGEFRSFLLWVIYVFFALACFKLLHATII